MATDKLVEIDHVKDFISREAAISEIMSEPTDAHYPSWYAEKLKQVFAADVVEVVRCKDCKHAPLPKSDYGKEIKWPKIDLIFDDTTCPYYCDDSYYSIRPRPDWFCCHGERRSNDGDKP